MSALSVETLNEWAEVIHENAVEHGWWDEPRSFGDIVALCHSELSEALEAYRDKNPMCYCSAPHIENGMYGINDPSVWGPVDKPEGVAVEMIDCIIRILDWCANEGVDVGKIIDAKHRYNKTRPYRHGGKVL